MDTVVGPIASSSGCSVIEDMPDGIIKSPLKKIPPDCEVSGIMTPDKSTAGEKSSESGLKSSEPWNRTLPRWKSYSLGQRERVHRRELVGKRIPEMIYHCERVNFQVILVSRPSAIAA